MIDLQSNMHIYLSGAVAVAIALIYLYLRARKRTQEMIDNQRQITRGLDKEITRANNQLMEMRSVVMGLGQKVTDQQELIQHLSERVIELENVDSDGRLYSRANKMVQLGADVDELIEECELPKAEAELMLALQKKIAGKQKVPSMDVSKEKRRP